MYFPILSLAAGAYELAGYAHIEFQFPLRTFLKALKEACLRLKIVKIHLQKAEMNELVAAAGLWKYRCDTLKREVMDQVKGMGDKMDWDTYYPEGRTPLDDVPGPTERPRQGLQNFVEERSQPVQ